MPVIPAARRIAWHACGCTGALVLACLAAVAVLLAADQRAHRKEQARRLDAELRVLLRGQR